MDIKNFLHIVFKKYKCYVTVVLILINVLVFGWMFLQKPVFDSAFMAECGAMIPGGIEQKEYYRFITAMFLHFDLRHLGNNMLMLAAIGSTTERNMGSISFAMVYILGGIAGNLCSAWNYARLGVNVVAAGASGAVFAVIGGLLCVVIANKGKLENFTTKRVLLFILLILYQGFTTENVDNYAHAGGLVAGILIGGICCFIRKNRRERF